MTFEEWFEENKTDICDTFGFEDDLKIICMCAWEAAQREPAKLEVLGKTPENPKFEIGEKLTYLPNLTALIDEELNPCLPCEVIAIQASYLINRHEIRASYQYVIRFQTFDDDRTVEQHFLHRDYQAALASAKDAIIDRINIHKTKGDLFKERLKTVQLAIEGGNA